MNNDPLVASVATALAEMAPTEWNQATMDVVAQIEPGDTVGLNVSIVGPGGEKIESPSDTLVRAITALYVGYFEHDREWTKCTIEINDTQNGKMQATGSFEFAKKDETTPKRYKMLRRGRNQPVAAMSANLAALFGKHAALSLDKHLALAARLPADAAWEFDLDEGMLRFGASMNYPVQALGVWNDKNASWQWAWDDYKDPPPAILGSALRLKERGERESVVELATASPEPGSVNPDCLAMIACGICGADFWFECRDDEGSIYLLGEAPHLRDDLAQTPEEIIEVFSQLLDGVDFNHRFALESYLLQKGYSPLFRDGILMARSNDGRHIEGVFNKESRLEELIIS